MEMETRNEDSPVEDLVKEVGESTDEQERARVWRTEEGASRRSRGEGAVFTDLPDACISLIVSNLSPKDLARCACVCQGFRSTWDSDSVWDQFIPKSAVKVVVSNDELKAASKKKIFLFLRKPLLLRETLAYWLDESTGGVCYSLAAKGLRVVWGDESRFWVWCPRPGARWPEVACLREVCWFHTSGSLKCDLPPGKYTLSWRIQFETHSSSVLGWDRVPTEFSVITTDGYQTSSHRYLTNSVSQQSELGDLTPIRLVDERWFEFDAGEITVVEEEKATSLEFFMVETESGDWKSGIALDGVVLRPSSLTKITGRYLSVEELAESSLQNQQGPPDERPSTQFRGRFGVRGPNRGDFPRRRFGMRHLLPNPPPRFDAGEN